MKNLSLLTIFSFFLFGTTLTAQSWTDKAGDAEVNISIQISDCTGFGALIIKAENLTDNVISKELNISMDTNGKSMERTLIISRLQPRETRIGDCCASSAGGSNSICVVFAQDVELNSEDVEISLK